MPTNLYECDSCNEKWTYIGPFKQRPCPKCQSLYQPLLPQNIPGPAVMEVVDSIHNTKWRNNFEERAQKRNSFYMKKEAKERARVHGDPVEKHGGDEDDAKLV